MIGEILMFVFKDPHDEMIIDKVILEKITGLGTIPMLWCRSGDYCVIPKEVVQNAMNSAKSFQQTDLKRTPPVITIMWSQGIPISNLAGRALVGE
ncbi:hypothetical protein KAR91_78865 [Candidatus Pacearchaeota archaeon]|nr:hypothetical protein [Candidatus Pacearchaeota archaeon]